MYSASPYYAALVGDIVSNAEHVGLHIAIVECNIGLMKLIETFGKDVEGKHVDFTDVMNDVMRIINDYDDLKEGV